MNTQEAIEILERHQLWRKGLPPYEHGGERQPHTPAQLGEALTHAIEHMKRSSLPKIEGLQGALNNVDYDKPDVTDYLTVGEFFIADENYRKAHSKVVNAAREYLKHSEGGA